MNEPKESTVFWDKEALYDEHVSPLMVQIIALAKEHKIPMVAVFQFCDTEENGPGYVTTILPGENQSDKMLRVVQLVKPARPIAWTETHVTNPDGSKHITIGKLL